jgi:hypothetical protein
MRHITLIITALALAVAAPAVAGKGGNGNGNGNSNGGGGGGGSRASATLSITPNDAPAYSRVWGSGCGYEPSSEVYIDIQKPAALAFTATMPDSSGCIAFTFTTDEPGNYGISARQQLSNGGHWTVMATYSLPVI